MGCRRMNQKYKAEELAKRLNRWVAEVAKGQWAIPASGGGMHKVLTATSDGKELKEDEYTCDCKGFEYTQNCYHIMAVKILLGN